MRRELADSVADLFQRLDLDTGFRMGDGEQERLIALARFAVRGRSAVERDGRTRDIELIPDPESPTRLAKVLNRVLAGAAAIGIDRDTAWAVITRMALDSIPELRLRALKVLTTTGEPMTTTQVRAQLENYPQNTTLRALEDLAAHGLATREPQGAGKADIWQASELTLELAADMGVPEISPGIHPDSASEEPDLFFKTSNDKSGTPPDPQRTEAA
jgi:hypothetical protein